jgi:transcriptional regulator with XRE-family HTH domain
MFTLMKMMRHFPESLRSAVAALNLTQQEFADQAGISVALLTKIFRGEMVHRKSLRLLLDFLRKPAQGKKGQKTALQLITAYLQDAFEEFGIPDEEAKEINLRPELLSARQRAILSIFNTMPGPVLAALYCMGTAAKNDAPLRDTIFAMADMANSQHRGGFPPHFFRQGIERPAKKDPTVERSFRLAGGSMGEIVAALANDE